MQHDMFSQQSKRLVLQPMVNADVLYMADFIDSPQATELYQNLQENLSWRQESIKMYGKSVRIPRLQAWYGDAEAKYTYSGLDMVPMPWTVPLLKIKQDLETLCDTQFNSVLANWYRDGQDSMGWHADNEPELGREPVIASVTVGQPRDFDLRHKTSGQKVRLTLQNGSLLVMRGATQTHWQHSLPKRMKLTSGRINLTFRRIFPDHSLL